MVDLGKKKGGDSGGSKSKKKSSGSKKKSSGSSPGSAPESYSPDDDEVTDPTAGSVSDVSKEWAEAGDNLNYAAQNGEAEKQYVKRQIQECKEFYESYVDTALDNMANIEEFTMVNHALLLSLAQNRIGIKEVLMDEFGYSESAAIEQTDKIVRKAGEGDALSEVCHELTEKVIKE
jgi:hypothetical protein